MKRIIPLCIITASIAACSSSPQQNQTDVQYLQVAIDTAQSLTSTLCQEKTISAEDCQNIEEALSTAQAALSAYQASLDQADKQKAIDALQKATDTIRSATSTRP